MSDISIEEAPKRREWRPAGIIFFGLLAVVLFYAAAMIISPFITAIVLAGITVILTFPTFEKLSRRMNNSPNRAAIIMLIAIILLIVVPFSVLGVLLVEQANTVFVRVQSLDAQQMLQRIDLASRLQWIHRFVPTFDPKALSAERLFLPAVQLVPGWVAQHGAAVVGGIAGMALQLALVMLASFFFYVEGSSILLELAILSPLPPQYDREFATKLKEVIDATFRGQVASALAQGVATGIGLAIVGIPGAAFWGAVATVLGLLPMVGAAVVWVPALIYLFIAASMGQRPYWQPIVLTAWGLLVVSVVDNIVRPWVMKGKAEIPAIPLLFAVLGGVQAFGFIGLVIGPVVFSLLMTIIDIYKRSFHLRRSDSAVA